MAVLDDVYASPLIGWSRYFRRTAVAAGLLAAVLSLAWALWLARDAGDLAAQYAWTDFVRAHPRSAYNLSWYGGIHPASYSIISPYLMAGLGVRTTAVVAATVSATLGGVLLGRSGIQRPLWPSLGLAVLLWCNIACGRTTFMLGMAFALAATVLATDGKSRAGAPVGPRSRVVAAALLGATATMCSPVAGLFVEVLAAALFLSGQRWRAVLIAPGPALVVAATAVLFPFSGVQPFPWYSALPTVAAAIAVAVLAPKSWRIVRAGAWVYAIGVVLCWIVPTPIGSNVERLALSAGAVVLFIATVAVRRTRTAAIAAYVAVAALGGWTIEQPISDFINSAAATATVADAGPLITELRRLNAQQGRVEVVPLRSHWEASGIAPYVDLARGWNRQADVARNPLFYDGTLTATSYHDWLRYWSVGFVVLPSDEPDAAGITEAALIATGPSWLHPVWSDGSWRVFRVDDIEPLVSAPSRVISAGPAALEIDVPREGSVLVRIAWSPWLAIDAVDNGAPSRACLSQKGRWTELSTQTAGTFTIEANYNLDRGTPCPAASDLVAKA